MGSQSPKRCLLRRRSRTSSSFSEARMEESREKLVTMSVAIDAAKLLKEAASLGIAFEGNLPETATVVISAEERDLLEKFIEMGLVTGMGRAPATIHRRFSLSPVLRKPSEASDVWRSSL